VAMEHLDRAASVQERDPGSTLAFYRAMISFRKAHPALEKGEMQIVDADDSYISLLRAHDGKRLFCAFNLSNGARPVVFPPGDWRIDRGAPFKCNSDDRVTVLPPWQACFAQAGSG